MPLTKLCAAVCVVVFALLGTAVSAQGKKATVRKLSGPIWTTHDCGHGVGLRLRSIALKQGSLVLVRVNGVKPTDEVKGEWDGNVIPMWTTKANANSKQSETWGDGLLGIDLEHPVGKDDLAITVKTGGGEPVNCSVSVAVTAGNFATEKLTVAPQFVEPSPEQLARAQEETKRLHEIYATVTPEELWKGRFRIPLNGVKTGGNFGKRRVLNGEPSSPHSGVDFPAATGTPVHASQRGRVVMAEPLYFSGNTVVVDHGLGVYTFYGHLSAIAVKVGDSVEAGAVLGKVGATGRVTGPHLHWGLEVNRARVNAMDIVKLSLHPLVAN